MNNMFFHDFPYTDFHEMNLSWVVKKICELNTKLTQFVSLNTIKYANPIQWDITSQYETNTVVIDPVSGVAYLSVQPVPMGISLSNEVYWTKIFDLGDIIGNINKNLTIHNDGYSTTSTYDLVTGDWVLWNGILYEALHDIDIGDAYVPDANIVQRSVEELIVSYVENLERLILHVEDLVASEVTARADADDVIRALIEAEADERERIDLQLSDLIASTSLELSDLVASEVTAREDADNVIRGLIGDLDNLNTSDKTDVVSAINEVLDDIILSGSFTTPEKFGAVGDGVHDDTAAIQAAIDSGARNVVFANKYYISDTIRLTEFQMLVGFYSLITTDDDIIMFDATDRSHWTLQGLHLVKGENNNHLHLVGSGANWTIHNCKFTNDVPADFSNWVGGIEISRSTDGLHDNFCGRIENCHIVRGNITIHNHTDGFMINNIIWANSGTLSPARYGVELIGSSWLVSGNQIVGGTSGAMHVEGTQEQILDNFFDGSYATLNTGKGLIATNCGEGLIIQGNKFYNQYANAIQLTSCQQVLIDGNTFRNNNRSGTAYNEIEVNQQTYGNRHLITSNTFVYNNDSARPYNIVNQYSNDIITLKNNYITGYANAANAYCYVNYKTILSEGNIINGRLYRKYSGTVHKCNSNYGLAVPLEMNAASLHTVYINGAVDNAYSATITNGVVEVIKGDNGNLDKAITVIVSYYNP